MVAFGKASETALFVMLVVVAWAPVRGQGNTPLSEANLTKLIELQIDDDVIAAKLKKAGIDFVADPAAIERLKKSGAAESVLNAVREAGARGSLPAGGKAISYQDVVKLLQLGLDENEILKRLERSPTIFTLDAAQVQELKQAGATEALITAMQRSRAQSAPDGPKVTDFAIVLDCSGSMAELSRDGQIKMNVAKQVVTELVAKMPEKLRVTFVIYGHDRDLNCQAVQVCRPLSALDAAGKSELASSIAGLRPIGGTPIALALEVAGKELAKNDAPCGLVLLTDGKETCGGNPAEVARTLAGNLRLSYGVNVIGFDVQDDERNGLAGIADAGKGKYYNAQTAAELVEIVKGLQKELQVVARPAPTGRKVLLGAARFVQINPPAIELPALESLYLAGSGVDRMALRADHVARIDQYGKSLRIPPSVKVEKFDLWWVPQQGRAVRISKDLAVDETTLIIKPEEHLGLVRVTGKGLPAASVILLTPVGTANFATRAAATQTSAGYGKDMVVPPGDYDLWIEPSDGGKSERVAERLKVEAGKATVVE
jgi:Mg-chelatase subunit ChlD